MLDIIFRFFGNVFYLFSDYSFTQIVLWITIFFYRISLTYAVFTNAKRRKLDNPTYWAIISFFAGTVAAIMYFFVNIGTGKKSKPMKSKLIAFCAFFMLCIMGFTGSLFVYNYETAEMYKEHNNAVVYKEGLKYVAYDKMGNAYNVLELMVSESKRVPAYTSNGEKLDYYYFVDADGYALSDYNIDDFEERAYPTKDEQSYNYDKYDDFGNPYTVYFDKEKNIYYLYSDCSWDKEGNLIFQDDTFTKITYENTVKVTYDESD